jgi:GTPase-associated protein 1, N-terminal domain type 1
VSTAAQLLFGYDDGHRLLASSRQLDPETLLRLQGATDAALSSDCPPLVTGVALPKVSEYAFCVTWPAPELPRAGAVWGHVLMVGAGELAVGAHAQALLTLPRRPASREPDFSPYSDALELETPDREVLAQLAPREPDRVLLERVIAASYGSRESAICVHDDLGAATRALLALWGGQWPQLRAEFSFRTRQEIRDEASSFDLTVAAKVRGDGDYPPVAEQERTPAWIAALTEDLLADTATPLREFLWSFGPAGSPDRLALRRLAKLWIRVAAGEPARVRAYLERHWPGPSEGAQLKFALFGSTQNRWWRLDERTRVRTLLEGKRDAWAGEELELRHRARARGID